MISSVAPNDAQSSANNQGSDENNVVEASTDDKPQQMSKKARKKLARMEKRLATRKERRKLEKMRRKERRRTARENGVVASRHCLKNKITYSKCHVRVAIDLSYEDVGGFRELRSSFTLPGETANSWINCPHFSWWMNLIYGMPSVSWTSLMPQTEERWIRYTTTLSIYTALQKM